MNQLNPFTKITGQTIAAVAREFGTPVYLYDQALIEKRCQALVSMPNAFGITARYAMKANPTKAILRLMNRQGVGIDASSMNEAVRAHMAGISYDKMMLTTQEVLLGQRLEMLQNLMLKGMRYNVCSLRQLELIADFAAANNLPLSMRIHPGIGAGESASRNTGDNYSSFGVHLSDVPKAMEFAVRKNVKFDKLHEHIGSGGDPEVWRTNIDHELKILEQYFPDADTISFGGGLKEARVPQETAADAQQLGNYAKQQIEAFYQKTGRKLKMEVEPGTYLVANAGYIITQVMDKKRTGDSGLNFLLLNGGMELNARPLLYGSTHPFYVVSQNGELLSSEFDPETLQSGYQASVVGRCCETGDSQTLDAAGRNMMRPMAEPQLGDYLVIGGAGAYCSAMSPYNYNSHQQAPEVMLDEAGEMVLIRKQQTLDQMLQNEL